MNGMDIMLTALHLSLANNESYDYPEGFIRLDENYNPIEIEMDAKHDEEISETANIYKKEHLDKVRKWVHGRHLRVGTIEDYPLSYTFVRANGTRAGAGVAFEVINYLMEKFHCTYDVIVPKANIIGSKLDFENSLIELINKSKIDVAAAFIPLLSEQREHIFYSKVVLDEGEWLMVMQRPRESASGSGLLEPFDFSVWILILTSLLVISPIIYLFIMLHNKLTESNNQKLYPLGHCAWFVYGALLKQGSVLSPIADSTRILFATWWMFITILTSFYTANLTAFLTLSKFTLPFNNAEDILYKNKHFVTIRGNGVEYTIRTVNDSLYMLSDMIETNRAQFTESTNDTYNLYYYVEQNGYVFVRDRPAIIETLYKDYQYRRSINSKNEKFHCPFATSKQPMMKKKRSFAFPIGSNISDLFDTELLHMVESGIIKHLSSRRLPRAEICPTDLASNERQLRNSDLMMTYAIMLAGFATSLAVFTSEMLFRCINQHQNNSKWQDLGVGRTPAGQKMGTKSFWQNKMSGNSSKVVSKKLMTITPPPPYQSIFSKNAYNTIGIKSGWQNITNIHPPENGVRRFINGREYIIYISPDGSKQLVPVRSPSATLFQYTYTK